MAQLSAGSQLNARKRRKRGRRDNQIRQAANNVSAVLGKKPMLGTSSKRGVGNKKLPQFTPEEARKQFEERSRKPERLPDESDEAYKNRVQTFYGDRSDTRRRLIMNRMGSDWKKKLFGSGNVKDFHKTFRGERRTRSELEAIGKAKSSLQSQISSEQDAARKKALEERLARLNTSEQRISESRENILEKAKGYKKDIESAAKKTYVKRHGNKAAEGVATSDLSASKSRKPNFQASKKKQQSDIGARKGKKTSQLGASKPRRVRKGPYSDLRKRKRRKVVSNYMRERG